MSASSRRSSRCRPRNESKPRHSLAHSTKRNSYAEQLERTEQMLVATQCSREDEQQQLAATRLTLEQWQERAAGFERQLAERDARLRSLEEKYTHAQQALTHFREAAKTQRDEELRRHEHERQTLQVELCRAQAQAHDSSNTGKSRKQQK